ncbi:hypothetical protein QJQ45_000125 [Haematococcus lacustris]|nr:hypothetical protein QJQ45_000125 [Haematococcus lacustris]
MLSTRSWHQRALWDDNSITEGRLARQQRVGLARQLSLLQPLRSFCVAKVVVYDLRKVTAGDVVALAPLCQDCTYFQLEGGSMEPSLEFWHQLVQIMPAVEKLSLLQPLRSFCVAKVVVYDLRKVTAGDVVALAPLCQDCTYFQLEGGSMEPSLEFWHQLVQIMPAVEKFVTSQHCDITSPLPALAQMLLLSGRGGAGRGGAGRGGAGRGGAGRGGAGRGDREGDREEDREGDREEDREGDREEDIKVPVKITQLMLSTRSWHQRALWDDNSITEGRLARQQRVGLARQLSLLQPLRSFCVAKVVVYDLRKVTAGDVVALAPLCQDCTYFQLEGGSMEPSLEFWHQLVQIMPAVEKQVSFWSVAGAASEAMCKSLLLMAVKPNTPSQPGRIQVVFGAYCQWLWLSHCTGAEHDGGAGSWQALVSQQPPAASSRGLCGGTPHIGKAPAEQCESVFDPAPQIGVGINPDVTQAFGAASWVRVITVMVVSDHCNPGISVVTPQQPSILPQPPCSQAATQQAASEPGPSTPPPAKRSERTMVVQAAEPTQPTKGHGRGKGKAAKSKQAPHPGRADWQQLVRSQEEGWEAKPADSTDACDGQQTAPAVSQRDMQQQAAVDGSASATDGYSPAGEAPPPATRLLDLPPALLDDIACRVMQLGARSLLPLTCSAFSLARLLHIPALGIQLGSQCCDQLLTPRVIAALQARKCKLELTVVQPDIRERERYKRQPQTELTQHYTDLLAHVLSKLDNCAAVEVCRLVNSDIRMELPCSPDLAQRLVDSFPGLTALELACPFICCSGLASMLSHPRLSLQLQQLELHSTTVKQPQQPGSGALTLDPFQGARLKQLKLEGCHGHPSVRRPPLPILQPLAQHLTQLHLKDYPLFGESPEYFVEYLQPLAQLQVLTLPRQYQLEGLTELLQVLPQLHTLQLPGSTIKDQQQLGTLLAATQITSLQLRGVEGLDTSYADAPCSWQGLELTGKWEGDWKAIACLPLHSLSQPLVLKCLHIGVEDILNPEVAAALHNMAYVCKLPVKIKSMCLAMLTAEERRSGVITPAFLQQQRVDLAQLVALLQLLQCCGEVLVCGLHEVTAADVLALAPLCRACTGFDMYSGSVKPPLELWRQLLQLMPAVQKADSWSMRGIFNVKIE